jgi:hypothetical protein
VLQTDEYKFTTGMFSQRRFAMREPSLAVLNLDEILQSGSLISWCFAEHFFVVSRLQCSMRKVTETNEGEVRKRS